MTVAAPKQDLLSRARKQASIFARTGIQAGHDILFLTLRGEIVFGELRRSGRDHGVASVAVQFRSYSPIRGMVALGGAMILDLGCGPRPLSGAIGVDIDPSCRPSVIARGEMLPFRDGIFCGVHSSVALPYMHVPRTLAEIARVLQPGGSLRLTLHSFRWRLGIARHANLGGLIFFAYVCLNSLLLRWLGRQFRFLSQCESVQTEAGMRRLLSRVGFEHVRIDRGRRRFVVTATLRP